MHSDRSTVLERLSLTFCVEGLQAREELLFKAFVRLLAHLTHQQWSYQPPTANTRADLLVVAEGVEPAYSQAAGQPPQLMLSIGAGGAEGHGLLTWPLKPDSLEKELNRLGGMAVKLRAAQLTGQQAPAFFAASADGWPNAPEAAIDSTRVLMRLQRWPPAQLLAGTGRMRLATLLTGSAMSLDELAHRSALPLPVCKAFAQDLQRAKLLVLLQALSTSVRVQPGNAPSPKAAQPGLLDRIRMRLGIHSVSR